MSSEGETTRAGFIVGLMGVLILTLGLLIVYFSLITESGVASPRVLTPLGAFVSIIGLFMIIARKT